jgi:succinate dehydrogenase / fumarate reductase, cytochrome b subunit
MGLKRNVSLATALRYKGQGPMLAFILHRIGGSALFIFFTLYILSLLGMSFANTIFSNWVFQIILLVFGLFHAINGLRITILDLFPKLIENYRNAISIEWVVYILVVGFALFVVLRNTLGG